MRSLVCRARMVWTAFIDAIIPPRPDEHRVRTISYHDLLSGAAAHTRWTAETEVRFLLPYQRSSVKALVHELKYHRTPRALELAGALLCDECLGICEEALSTPLLMPVPMHEDRLRERGFNQTHILCETIMNKTGDALIYEPGALVRTRPTSPQQKLSRRARLRGARYSMIADRSAVAGRTCIVIDDVTTTGATLLEARRALIDAGAVEVHLLALAG
ncbi:MAG TPA: phosphoribosyltransferase family protein [Candidatus Paceibacterota bacterium]